MCRRKPGNDEATTVEVSVRVGSTCLELVMITRAIVEGGYRGQSRSTGLTMAGGLVFLSALTAYSVQRENATRGLQRPRELTMRSSHSKAGDSAATQRLDSQFSGSAGAGATSLLSVRLEPQNVTLWGASSAQRFVVMGKYSDGLERDVTAISRLSVSEERVARIQGGAGVVAIADGQAVLSASTAGQTARTTVRVRSSEEKHPFSFARDLGGLFTKRGCNSSDCHGSVKGKGGFKLSANALYPRDDHKWIVEGGTYQVLSADTGERIPRVNLKEPEKSLLLLKPTMIEPHGGGQRFSRDSSDYETILSWVKRGAPFGEEGKQESVRIERLEVFPKDAVLDGTGKQQLLVTAHLTNGQQEDVTQQVLYVSNNPAVVEVNDEGLVKAVKTGETAVMIRAAGQAISAGFGVIAKPAALYPKIAGRNFIDDHIFRKLRKFNIIPSELSSDQEFLRRVCLDLTGALPPPQRVREFLSSQDPQKRDKLIKILLNSPEYVDYWTFRFADVFRVALFAQPTAKYTQSYWEWIRNSVAENRPYDQIARERIAAQGWGGPSSHYFGSGGEMPRAQDAMAEQVRVFFGRRLDCAQCHNHPYDIWSQNQFWGMTAFYGRLTRLGDPGRDVVIMDDPAGHGEFGQGAKVTHPRTKEQVMPQFLDGKRLPEIEQTDLRMQLAEWMTSQPYFAEAIVNRIWSYFFGRGIVEPVDDFRLTNPPTHPDLLEVLAKDFREHGYDLKHLIGKIVESRTYQLSGTPNETNKDDKVNYSHAVSRPLDAEVLLDAISQAADVPEDFGPGASRSGRLPLGTRAINIIWSDNFASQFLDVYGRPNRLMIPHRKVGPNLSQALHLLAGPTYTQKLSKEGGRIDWLLRNRASDQQVIEELYLAALSRFPTTEEKAELEGMIRQRSSRREAIEDFAWGLMASQEFAYNH
ncbi:MAG: DUF1553 domain-containing protein [Acidobacteria bacterium]|nr:DUF1553 domain-containing protein [Acidobacteriota bacterium]